MKKLKKLPAKKNVAKKNVTKKNVAKKNVAKKVPVKKKISLISRIIKLQYYLKPEFTMTHMLIYNQNYSNRYQTLALASLAT